MENLTLGIPKGSLYQPVINLMGKVGIKVVHKDREFEAVIEGTEIFNKGLILRPEDIPTAIGQGILDCGITGFDFLFEQNLHDVLTIVRRLNFSRNSLTRPARIVVYGRGQGLVDNKDITVSAEYPNLARQTFRKARIIFSTGTTEAKIKIGMYDFGVGVTDSGKTIVKNGLSILKQIIVSPIVLLAREKKATPEIRLFGDMMAGALASVRKQLIKMNVPASKKGAVVAIPPTLESPTINKLADGSFAIESVVPIARDPEKNIPSLADLIMQLKRLGASGIITQDLNCIL